MHLSEREDVKKNLYGNCTLQYCITGRSSVLLLFICTVASITAIENYFQQLRELF